MDSNPNQEVISQADKKQQTRRFFNDSWNKDVVKDESAPIYYSRRAIYGFSFFFATIFGAILLAINIRKINKKAATQVVLFGIGYFIVSIFIANKFNTKALSIAGVLNLGGAYILDALFWQKYIGSETKYRARPIWKPLIISLIITGGLLYLMILGDKLEKQFPPLTSQETVLEETITAKDESLINDSKVFQADISALAKDLSSGNVSKLNSEFQNLLNSGQKIQPQINELQKYLQEHISDFSNEEARKNLVNYMNILDIRERYVKKAVEFAAFGVTVDWNNPTDEQMEKAKQFTNEIVAIDKEFK